MSDRLFRDRRDAGRVLAGQLERYCGRGDVIVLGLPRGGVPGAPAEQVRELLRAARRPVRMAREPSEVSIIRPAATMADNGVPPDDARSTWWGRQVCADRRGVGVAVRDRLVLNYTSVNHWGEPGHWTLNHSGLAYSDDQGQTWTKDVRLIWPGDSNFGQVAIVDARDRLYFFGIPGGRYGGVALARVAVL